MALLSSPGSGKSATLRALSQKCGGTVVHALLDFDHPASLDPVAAVAAVAFQFMRGWTNLRRDPTFHRVGLCLLALNEPLSDNHDTAEKQLKARIKEYVQDTPAAQAANKYSKALFDTVQVATAITGIAQTPHGGVVLAVNKNARPLIGALLRGPAYLGIRRAMGWYRRIPEAEDADTINALIKLSHVDRKVAPRYLMDALLADIEDHAARHSEVTAPCRCIVRRDLEDTRHDHAWLLLVDNAGTDAGRAFLAALLSAKQQRLDGQDGAHAVGDRLLVMTATGQWNPAWRPWWREPWQSVDMTGRERIPLLSQATRAQWSRHVTAAVGQPGDRDQGWYPVWLDPLTREQADKLGPLPGPGADPDALRELVHRLSGGRGAAVKQIQERVDTTELPMSDDGLPRTVLMAVGDDDDPALWDSAVRSCVPDRLPVRRPWRTVPDLVAVAAYLRHNGRASDDLAGIGLPTAAPILRQLRLNLWVSTFAARPSPLWRIGNGDREHPADLHPWLASCLFSGLAAEDRASQRKVEPGLWDELFQKLAGDQAAGEVLGRTLFCALATERFDEVVAALVARFDVVPHLEWVRLLDEVTNAPCRFPARESTACTYLRLVPDEGPDRSPIEVAVTTVVALLWLYRDPLTVPDVKWDRKIHDAFEKLANNSGREELGALTDAAGRFAPDQIHHWE